MAYIKNTWVNQDVERPKTYEVTDNPDGSITLTDSFGTITEAGTPVNATNMNHIEDGIAGCAIRKHNLTETFNLGEWVLGGTGDDEGIYKSLVASNVGNAVTNDTYWEKVKMGGSSRNIGEIVASTIPLTDAGLHLSDGSLIDGSGIYSAFVDYIADLYTASPTANYFTTESDWQTSVSTYGVCGKFVYDSVNNTVRLPKVTGFVEGTIDVTALGDLVEAGLPNITGGVKNVTFDTYDTSNVYGAFNSITNVSNATAGSSDAEKHCDITFSASSSNSIYGNSSTVQPQAIKGYLYIVIATTTKTDIQVDIDDIATDLNGKVDKADCEEVQCVIETYQSGNSWYRVYSDGWCEQGGVISAVAYDSSSINLVYLKTFRDNYYNFQATTAGTDHAVDSACYEAKSATGIRVISGNQSGSNAGTDVQWLACGYIE